MKIHVFCTPSHEGLLNEFLLPSAPWPVVVHRGEQRGTGQVFTSGWLPTMRERALLYARLSESGESFIGCDADVQFFSKFNLRPFQYVDIAFQSTPQGICPGFFISHGQKPAEMWNWVAERIQGDFNTGDQFRVREYLSLGRLRYARISENIVWSPFGNTAPAWPAPSGICVHHALKAYNPEDKAKQLRTVRAVITGSTREESSPTS